MPDPRREVRQHNRRAVQRLFEDKHKQRLATAGSGSSGTGDTPALRAPSCITLSSYHAMAAAEATGGAGAGNESGAGGASDAYGGAQQQQQRQPAWVHVSARNCLLEPSLDAPSHLSQQLQLAAELQAHGVGGGLSAEEYGCLLSRATAPSGKPGAVGDVKRSCFALHVAKHRHQVELSSPPDGPCTQHERARAQRELYHHQQAILRNEKALARKRAASLYMGLTPAQADASFVFPNARMLDRLANEKYGGRWPLDNPHHQQLLRGEPIMSQVMRGDFYESYRGRQQGAQPPSHGGGGGGGGVDAHRTNKRDVRVASAINASVRRSKSCEQRAKGACFCAPVAGAGSGGTAPTGA